MAQPPRRPAEYDRPISPTASATTQNQPKPVGTHDRPARKASAAGIAVVVLLLIVLAVLAVLFFR